MNHKVNIQARIKRHSRILKENLGNTLNYSSNNTIGYKIVVMIIILLFPIYPLYPTITSFGDTRTSFYRGDIDEESILDSFEFGKELGSDNNETLFEAKDSFLSIGALIDDDEPSFQKLITYEVKKGDNISTIAEKYNISKNTIIWANNLKTKNKTLKIGTKLTFPPVTGVIYKVKGGDTISGISYKYNIPSKDIIAQNGIKNNYLRISQKLVIPGGEYIKEVVTKRRKYRRKKSYIARNINRKGMYPLRWHRPYSGAWGNCTWYVASYKSVDWRGNANRWLINAKRRGHAVGNYAVNGAIVVLGGRGYNRKYGHVAIVREIRKKELIVSDMNYRRLNQVTIRKIKRYGSHIKGYIYVK